MQPSAVSYRLCRCTNEKRSKDNLSTVVSVASATRQCLIVMHVEGVYLCPGTEQPKHSKQRLVPWTGL